MLFRLLTGNIIVLMAVFLDLEGQRKRDVDDDLVQFSGMVRDLQHQPLPYVNIIILNERRGTTSDQRGMFSFVVRPNDTILFSHMGHKGTIHVIPDSLGGQQYPADIFMVSDTFQLAEVRIYPWKTYHEFKEAFLALELPDDDEQRAYHNIALIKTQIKMNDYGRQSQHQLQGGDETAIQPALYGRTDIPITPSLIPCAGPNSLNP